MQIPIAVVAALLIGFLAGLLTFKVKVRWCPHCGGTTLPHRPGSPGDRRA